MIFSNDYFSNINVEKSITHDFLRFILDLHLHLYFDERPNFKNPGQNAIKIFFSELPFLKMRKKSKMVAVCNIYD
jgi:hypothetical protein